MESSFPCQEPDNGVTSQVKCCVTAIVMIRRRTVSTRDTDYSAELSATCQRVGQAAEREFVLTLLQRETLQCVSAGCNLE